MTPRHHQLLAFIKAHLSWAGHSPSRADMARELGLSQTRISTLLSDLLVLGMIERPQKGVYVPVTFREGSNFRPAGPGAPSLGALLATFDRMANRT